MIVVVPGPVLLPPPFPTGQHRAILRLPHALYGRETATRCIQFLYTDDRFVR